MKIGYLDTRIFMILGQGGCLPVFRGVYGGGKHGGTDGRRYSYSEMEDL
jgi:hypothetical protein